MKRGETIELDHHRLMCGDAREDLQDFIKEEKVKMILSDPPYGVDRMRGGTRTNDYDKPVTITKKLEETGRKMNSVEFPKWVGDEEDFNPQHMVDLGIPMILFGGNYYHNLLPNGKKWYVWFKKPSLDKGKEGGSWSDCELIYTTLDGYRCEVLHQTWWGMIRKGERRLESMTRNHPTQKPVGILIELLEKHTKKGDTILDPYSGGGSTLIACAETGRKCLAMEIMPEYCDRIISRYQQYKEDTIKKYGSFNDFLLT